jgi:flagellar biosynthetic protein FliR
MVAQVSGLAIAEVFDPSQENNVSVFSRLLFLVTLAIFVSIGGHRMVMGGLLDTFQSIPPGSASLPRPLSEALVSLVTQSFELGIRAAAPMVVSLLLANLILGLIGRTLPQLNILVIGLGMNSLVTFAVLSLALGAAAWVFQARIEPAVQAILAALRG